jgi:hypothetical protein
MACPKVPTVFRAFWCEAQCTESTLNLRREVGPAVYVCRKLSEDARRHASHFVGIGSTACRLYVGNRVTPSYADYVSVVDRASNAIIKSRMSTHPDTIRESCREIGVPDVSNEGLGVTAAAFSSIQENNIRSQCVGNSSNDDNRHYGSKYDCPDTCAPFR